MRIDSLKLLNFRNYAHLSLNFHSSLNLIYGKNGSGKTNLVEGIYVLFLTRSFRLGNEKTLIKDGFDACRVEGNIYLNSPINYRVYITREGKKVKIDNQNISKISDYIANVAIVLFHPDDLRFIKDAPSTRRKTLNISISLLYFDYLKDLNQYQILLKQRNAYLKQMDFKAIKADDYLLIITDKLIEYGLKIYEKRSFFIESLNSHLGDFYEKITGKKNLSLDFVSNFNHSKEELKDLYVKTFAKDLKFGKTHLGVHMDDVRFMLNGKDLKDFGSEGEQKNAIIAYKFSEIEIFKEKKGCYPVLILDDLFSELDRSKIENILQFLNKDVQTFITTTEINNFAFLNDLSYKQFKIEDGKIVEESRHGK